MGDEWYSDAEEKDEEVTWGSHSAKSKAKGKLSAKEKRKHRAVLQKQAMQRKNRQKGPWYIGAEDEEEDGQGDVLSEGEDEMDGETPKERRKRKKRERKEKKRKGLSNSDIESAEIAELEGVDSIVVEREERRNKLLVLQKQAMQRKNRQKGPWYI